MPETCEIWLGLVNICFYYDHKIFKIYHLKSCSVDVKAHNKLWRVRQYLVNVVLFGIKDL